MGGPRGGPRRSPGRSLRRHQINGDSTPGSAEVDPSGRLNLVVVGVRSYTYGSYTYGPKYVYGPCGEPFAVVNVSHRYSRTWTGDLDLVVSIGAHGSAGKLAEGPARGGQVPVRVRNAAHAEGDP